ncbi:beta-glucosidase [Labilibaculum antarcticum]|uniref:Glycosyl hydrolase n=1 Tax=Labilibaculum antarcticum TaxID=1717717 RepID=A0A1Y1CJ56_9BACT|nr:glycoside hydrolase family 3 C-terminal domain-containing protein [Labilibaculum antarcticum]BAX79311.1 glycosyl hydrolase [Labilibaculum antarcticum]
MKKYILIILTGILLFSCKPEVKIDLTDRVEDKIDSLINLMTLEEKVALCHGNTNFTLPGVPRLGIPELTMGDGPHSIKFDFKKDSWEHADSKDSSTYLPCGVALGATWNPELAYEFGSVLGREARFRDKDVHLAPGINIIRRPLCGRNFEYLSEDPLVSEKLGVEYIKGVQKYDVASCVKHFIAYNDKRHPNVWMSERTLNEIYLPAFIGAIDEANAMLVMGSYNKYKGEYMSENSYMLQHVLKDKLKFKGAVISDWSAVHNTHEAVYNGLDIEMGTEGVGGFDNYYMADAFLKLAKEGHVAENLIDDKVRRVLRIYFKTRLKENRPKGEFITQRHFDFALKAAEEGIVLLKNDKNLLPIDFTKVTSIAVIGDNATAVHAEGGGSSGTKAYYEITPLDGIKNLLKGSSAKVSFAKGYKTKDGENEAKLMAEALKLASESDVVIYVGGLNHEFDAERQDKIDMILPYNQDRLINSLAEANKNMAVVMLSGSSFEMHKWLGNVSNLVLMAYSGMEGGNALANVLSGKVNPSGKLSYTLPLHFEDAPEYAFECYDEKRKTDYYKEGVFVGYRYYDTYGVNTQFDFGYGLSYTSFDIKNVQLSQTKMTSTEVMKLAVEVENTGKLEGMEVVQVYIGDVESSVKRPLKELMAFEKVKLKSGEKKTIEFAIELKDLQFFDELSKSWISEPGKFKIYVGNSVENILVEKEIELL